MRLKRSARGPRRASSIALVLWSACACAQEIEPRSYSNAPVGVNFLIAGYAYAQGGLSLDPALPIMNAHLGMSTDIFAYARSFDFLGNSAKFDVIAPYAKLSGAADYLGRRLQRDVSGFNDPRFRLSVNFHGAPALSASEFRDYRQQLIVGASVQVSAPWGQYDPQRLVNIGSNRWSVKPESGATSRISPAAAARSTACRRTTSSRTGEWARRSRFRSMHAIRSRCMRAPASRRGPATTST